MNPATAFKSVVEVHPPGWRFPAGKSWLAGWITPPAGDVVTDVRARIHHRVILGLAGLPHPAFPGGESAGFSFFFSAQPGAGELSLEFRGRAGGWTEFFRSTITAAPDAPTAPDRPALPAALGPLVVALLRKQRSHPNRTGTELADDLMAAFVAEPLDCAPNPPLAGALEEPRATGRFRYGVIPVTGWLAIPGRRIARLTAVIDPLPPGELPRGLVRPDVVALFPALADRADSAFAGEVRLPDDFAEPVLLKIFAELDNGERHLAFAQRFRPHFHRSQGELPPQLPALAFVRAVRALHRAAGRYGLSRRGLWRKAFSLWAAYSARPAYRPARGFRPKSWWSRARAAPRRPGPGAPATTLIAAADDMLMHDPAQYLQIGAEALAQVQAACDLAGCHQVDAILDLPCGHGRVARWFRTAYPAARLVVSDTQEPGVRFCIEHLGATGVPARLDGSHWAALPGPFDIIWCGSLLTHFDREHWLEHLRRFAERLTPRGVLVFTTHGVVALDKLQTGEKDYGLRPADIARLGDDAVRRGFGYADYIDTPGYGISVSQPAWIRELLARETALQVRAIHESAWDQHQDVVVCTRL